LIADNMFPSSAGAGEGALATELRSFTP
jgi:hypothetical protein